jgi:hypothetical protein
MNFLVYGNSPYLVLIIYYALGVCLSVCLSLVNVYNMVRILKCKRLQWTENVARVGETRNSHRILVVKPLGKLEYLNYI